MDGDIRFGAPWGWLLRGVTIFCVVLFGAMVTAGFLGIPPHPVARWTMVGVPVLLVVSVVPFMVRGFTWKPGERLLIVHRLGWSTHLDLRGLKSAIHDSDAMSGSLRLCGNGGLFAFCGWFYSKKLGRFRVFGTDLPRAVVLRFADRVIVVTPDDPARFVSEMERAIAPGS